MKADFPGQGDFIDRRRKEIQIQKMKDGGVRKKNPLSQSIDDLEELAPIKERARSQKEENKYTDFVNKRRKGTAVATI